jgi:hypothetical protein
MEKNDFKKLEYRINFVKLREVWRDSSISKGAKVILMDLLLYGGVQGDIFPSQTTMAENHGYSVRHIRNLLGELRKNGLIGWDKFGYSMTNSYYTNEELYCLIDELPFNKQEKRTSYQEGNSLPKHLGISFPTNSSHEINHEESSHSSSIKCKKNCENGLIFSGNSVSYCNCPVGVRRSEEANYG